MPDKKLNIFTDFRFVTGLYLLVAIAVSLQKYFLGEEHYGNYLIFKNSFLHLIRSQDLYVLYPELKIDLFKYSPTFALLFFSFCLFARCFRNGIMEFVERCFISFLYERNSYG